MHLVQPKEVPCQTALMADGLHPHTAGYVVLGDSFHDVISSYLAGNDRRPTRGNGREQQNPAVNAGRLSWRRWRTVAHHLRRASRAQTFAA